MMNYHDFICKKCFRKRADVDNWSVSELRYICRVLRINYKPKHLKSDLCIKISNYFYKE
jgi:predicted Fe-S protein YdhL (DUF1289 family)